MPGCVVLVAGGGVVGWLAKAAADAAGGSTLTVRLITAVRVSQRGVTCAWSGHTPAPHPVQTATASAVRLAAAQSKHFTGATFLRGGIRM